MDPYTCQKLLECGIAEQNIRQKDLSEANLSQKNLSGIDLRGFTLNKVNFEYADLTGTDLRGLHFASANCVSATFVDADFRGADLGFGYFHNADFRGADLRGAHIADSVCNECDFSGADLRGAVPGNEHYNSDFRGADLRGVTIPDDVAFERLNCDVRGAMFTPQKSGAGTVNNRKLQRVQLLPRLKVVNLEKRAEMGTLVDITTEGMRISCLEQCAPNTEIEIAIMLPAGFPGGAMLEIRAVTVWSKPAANTSYFHTGLKILNVSGKTTKVIERLIREYRRTDLDQNEG